MRRSVHGDANPPKFGPCLCRRWAEFFSARSKSDGHGPFASADALISS
jgi:hypothetical protein